MIGIEAEITKLLAGANRDGGFPGSLVCTAEGLAIAASGEIRTEDIAAFTSLFEDVVARATRDLGLRRIDELTLRESTAGRYVVRPLSFDGRTRAFLVVLVPSARSWRRVTNALVTALAAALGPLMQEAA